MRPERLENNLTGCSERGLGLLLEEKARSSYLKISTSVQGEYEVSCGMVLVDKRTRIFGAIVSNCPLVMISRLLFNVCRSTNEFVGVGR